MEQTVSFGDWLRQRRRSFDLTQEELARRVGCATGTIKKIETDARRPSREIAALLATQLLLAPEEREDFIRCARAELAPDRLPPPTRAPGPAPRPRPRAARGPCSSQRHRRPRRRTSLRPCRAAPSRSCSPIS